MPTLLCRWEYSRRFSPHSYVVAMVFWEFFNMVAIVFLVVFNMFLLYVVARVFWELFITFTMVFLVVFNMFLLYVVAKGFWVLFSLLSMVFLVFFNMLLPEVGGKSHMFKSQAILKSLPSSLKSQYKLIKQVKSSQVSGSPQASQVESW